MAGGLDPCCPAEQPGEHESVKGIPGVEALPVDLEPVRGFPQGEAVADDAPLVVELDIGEGSDGLPDVVDRATGSFSQVLDADRLPVGEEAE